MRTTTRKAVECFLGDANLSTGNTHVRHSAEKSAIYLFGNEIAKRTPDGMFITNAGWFSNTTKERLNGIPGVRIQQIKGEWFLNGIEWNGQWTRIVQ